MPDLAPIVLFVYNRPAHTRRTLEALTANPESAASRLYIFCDGPKEGAVAEDMDAIQETRRIVSERNWCGTVNIHRSERNRGLADSIVGGVTQVVNEHGRAIVLEDDIEAMPGFLRYMNTALDLYEDEERVHQISGFMVPNRFWAKDTGFLRVSTSWGWATWARAWSRFRTDSAALRREVEAKGRREFDLDGFSFHFDELRRNEDGDLKTWAVKWYASIFLAGGLCLYPKRSLVRNRGFDGSGMHCENDLSGYFTRLPVAKRLIPRAIPLREDPAYLRAMQRSFRHRLQVWTRTTLRDRIARKLGMGR